MKCEDDPVQAAPGFAARGPTADAAHDAVGPGAVENLDDFVIGAKLDRIPYQTIALLARSPHALTHEPARRTV